MSDQDTEIDTTSQAYEENRLKNVLQKIAEEVAEHRGTLQTRHNRVHASGGNDYASNEVARFRVDNAKHMLDMRLSMQINPYFGRIDFIEDGKSGKEILYIGLGTLEDKPDEFLIYDWRAPICSMYYQAGPGIASYLAPQGIISGTIDLKRNYEIKNGEILSIYGDGDQSGDDVVKPLDEMLSAVLQRNTTGTMRQIVRSIQAEQDAIVRVNGDVVVVQGPAGSGKTIIALHRAAYLLYAMRNSNRSRAGRYEYGGAQRLLVFSPNAVFSNYISRVLPDLNEGQVRQVVIERFLIDELRKNLRGSFEIETREDQFEYGMGDPSTADYEIRRRASEYKGSVAIVTAIEALMENCEAKIESQFENIYTSPAGQAHDKPEPDRLFYSAAEMLRTYRSGSLRSPVKPRINAVIAEMADRVKGARRSSTVQASTVTHIEREANRLEQRLSPFREPSLVVLYKRLWNSPEMLNVAFDAIHKHNDEFKQPGSEPPVADSWLEAAAANALRELDAKQIAHEDIVPMLMICGAYRGYPTLANVDHAVIDEAQDYSAVYFEYIRRCLPEGCSLTIVGDTNQATNPLTNLGDYGSLADVFPGRISRMDLTRSYRSSQEITEFAGAILAEKPAVESVRSTGSKPKVVAFGPYENQEKTIETIVRRLGIDGYRSIAIVCKTHQHAEDSHRVLNKRMSVTLLTDRTGAFSEGLYVTSLLMAKGLEFDAVIVTDAANSYSRNEDRKLLYTACTRALHELYVCYSGEHMPLLPTDQELYEAYK